jgi:hypothetical protein
MRTAILIAIELILGAGFVVGFWYKNPDLTVAAAQSPTAGSI